MNAKSKAKVKQGLSGAKLEDRARLAAGLSAEGDVSPKSERSEQVLLQSSTPLVVEASQNA